MKSGLRLFLFCLLAAVVGGVLCYRLSTAPTKATVGSRESELEWLRQEYRLNETQFAAVKELHHRYAPESEELYRAVAVAEERTEKLIAANREVTPEVTAALADRERLQEQCRKAALTQMYAVSAHMAPQEAERYIATMKLNILEPGAAPQTSATHWPR